MKKLKRELSWSFSRNRLFQECRRAYYYNYYASWGGWERNAKESVRKAYILKNVRNIDAWVGDIVHQIIKWIIENKISGNNIDLETAIKKSKNMLMKTWEQSRSKAWMQSPKRNLNLLEHYYNCEPEREVLSLKLQKVTKSLRGLYKSGFLNALSNFSSENTLCVDELDSFNFEGIKVYAIPDFVLRQEGYVLYDWKTGKRSSFDSLQLSCYALYAVNKWKISADEIRIVPVYLTESPISFTPSQVTPIEDVSEYIRESVSDMKSVLSDIPDNEIDFEKCPKTSEIWRCKNCRFQEICK